MIRMRSPQWIVLLSVVMCPVMGFYCGVPSSKLYPYTTTIVTPLKHDESCLLYSEKHTCSKEDGRSLTIQFTHNKGDISASIKVCMVENKCHEYSHSWENTQWTRDDIDSLTAEFVFNHILILADFVPVVELEMRHPDDWQIMDQCRNVQINHGNCKRKTCQIYSCGHLRTEGQAGLKCMTRTLPHCGKGFCHGGTCIKGAFGSSCECEKRGFLRGDYLGEFCHLNKEEGVLRDAKLLKPFEIEIDFTDTQVDIAVGSMFENFYYQEIICDIKRLDVTTKIGGLQLSDRREKVRRTDPGTRVARFLWDIYPNTTYIIMIVGRTKSEDERSFKHFTVVTTPGYTVLPAPVNVSITAKPGNVFLLRWSYTGEIPAREFLVKITHDGKTEKISSLEPREILSLRSNTTYLISVYAINSIGDTVHGSKSLSYTTPVFTYHRKNHGKYDLAKWFFRNSVISLDDRYVYFKNTIRRDVRIKRLAILVDGGARSFNESYVFNSVRYDMRYENVSRDPAPYITVNYVNSSLPRRVYIGDRRLYNGYTNGALDPVRSKYHVYAVVWYASGNLVDVSVRYLGAINLSQIPWTMIFMVMAIGTILLTILNTLFNCCTEAIILRHAAAKRKKQTLCTHPSRASIVEHVYMKDIVPDPDYDMTENVTEKLVTDVQDVVRRRISVKSSFSLIDEFQ